MRASRLVVAACLCLMTYALTWAATSARPLVWVVLPAQEGVHAEVAEALKTEAERRRPRGIEWQSGTLTELERSGAAPTAIVTIGAQAWQDTARRFAREDSAPILLATLLPLAAFDQERASLARTRPTSAIVLDQPPGRHARLARAAMPHARRIGVLVPRGDGGRLSPLRDAFAAVGIELHVQESTPETLAADLVAAMSGNDALLALPAGQIYNRQNIGMLMAASYRMRVPILGYSPSIVSAGALAGVHVTPAEIGLAGGAALADALDGRSLPAPRAPAAFQISINPAVARAFGLVLDAVTLERAVRADER